MPYPKVVPYPNVVSYPNVVPGPKVVPGPTVVPGPKVVPYPFVLSPSAAVEELVDASVGSTMVVDASFVGSTMVVNPSVRSVVVCPFVTIVVPSLSLIDTPDIEAPLIDSETLSEASAPVVVITSPDDPNPIESVVPGRSSGHPVAAIVDVNRNNKSLRRSLSIAPQGYPISPRAFSAPTRRRRPSGAWRARKDSNLRHPA